MAKGKIVRGRVVWGVPMVRIDDLLEHLGDVRRLIGKKDTAKEIVDLIISNLNLIRRSAK